MAAPAGEEDAFDAFARGDGVRMLALPLARRTAPDHERSRDGHARPRTGVRAHEQRHALEPEEAPDEHQDRAWRAGLRVEERLHDFVLARSECSPVSCSPRPSPAGRARASRASARAARRRSAAAPRSARRRRRRGAGARSPGRARAAARPRRADGGRSRSSRRRAAPPRPCARPTSARAAPDRRQARSRAIASSILSSVPCRWVTIGTPPMAVATASCMGVRWCRWKISARRSRADPAISRAHAATICPPCCWRDLRERPIRGVLPLLVGGVHRERRIHRILAPLPARHRIVVGGRHRVDAGEERRGVAVRSLGAQRSARQRDLPPLRDECAREVAGDLRRSRRGDRTTSPSPPSYRRLPSGAA